MAHQKCPSGEVLPLRPESIDWTLSDHTSVLRLDGLEVIRLVLPAGKKLPKHQAPGHLILQCLEGRIHFSTETKTFDITAGYFVHLPAHEPHSLEAVEDSLLMLTIAEIVGSLELDDVNKASDESFPASDPPALTSDTRS